MVKVRQICGFILALLVSGVTQATSWNNQQIGAILPPDSRDCVMFTMVGVSTVDPIVNSVPWVAIPSSQAGYSLLYSFLLWAKATGTPVNVVTTGALAGGACTAGGNVVGLTQIYAPN